MKILNILSWSIKTILIFLIVGLRPLLGPAECLFVPTCTRYARQQLQKQPLLRALLNIVVRVVQCNPIYTFFFQKK